MEEFFLHSLLAAQKLNVVHQKNVDLTIFLSELNHGFHLERFNHLVDEVVNFDITNSFFGIVLLYFICDSVKKMSFSET